MTTRTHTPIVPTDATSDAVSSVFDPVFIRVFTSHAPARLSRSTPAHPVVGDGTDPLQGGHHRRRTQQSVQDHPLGHAGGER